MKFCKAKGQSTAFPLAPTLTQDSVKQLVWPGCDHEIKRASKGKSRIGEKEMLIHFPGKEAVRKKASEARCQILSSSKQMDRVA